MYLILELYFKFYEIPILVINHLEIPYFLFFNFYCSTMLITNIASLSLALFTIGGQQNPLYSFYICLKLKKGPTLLQTCLTGACTVEFKTPKLPRLCHPCKAISGNCQIYIESVLPCASLHGKYSDVLIPQNCWSAKKVEISELLILKETQCALLICGERILFPNYANP